MGRGLQLQSSLSQPSSRVVLVAKAIVCLFPQNNKEKEKEDEKENIHGGEQAAGGREQDQNYNAVFCSNSSKLYSWDKATVSFFLVNQEEEEEKEEEVEEEEEEEEEITTIMSLPQQCSRLAVVVKVIVSFQ